MSAPTDKKETQESQSSAGPVGRGGLKLEAALARFPVRERIRGAYAVDVGASTGGFTEVMLNHGAHHVVAVDAGHGQLHERLRRDPRVESRENTDWKRLSLSEAPGPFDFFTVDVSFVAARNMLRGLAFRLRPGAEGVVLIKPQFELPDHLVKKGDVSAPHLRALAVEKFRAKAASLGFELRAFEDSPVAGGEGTVEILAHVAFRGRTERLPAAPDGDADGDSTSSSPPLSPKKQPTPQAPRATGKSAREPRSAAAHASGDTLRWFAVTAPGTEDIAAAELSALPDMKDAKAVPGGVEWRGDMATAFAANLRLRVPTRILLRAGEMRAREFGKLRHQLARVPWERFLAKGAPVHVSASATRSRLYHTGGIEEALRAAIGDRLGAAPPEPDATEPDANDASAANDSQSVQAPASAAQRVLIRGVQDVWTVSIDTSGDRLHRRGWRTDAGEAPLRETLAAALLYWSGWKPGDALVDPMCGAGTLPIEAATMSAGMAPGSHRAFSFEAWPGLAAEDRARWASLRSEALARVALTSSAPIVASDREPKAVETTRENAERAGVLPLLRIEVRALADVEAPAASGTWVANPPYGERLGSRRDLPALYRQIGGLLRARFRGWNAVVVVPDVRLASAFRLPVKATQTLTHGGLRVTLLRFAP